MRALLLCTIFGAGFAHAAVPQCALLNAATIQVADRQAQEAPAPPSQVPEPMHSAPPAGSVASMASNPEEVRPRDLYGIAHAVGTAIRIPAACVMVVLAGICMVRAAPARFRRAFDMDPLIAEQAKSFPTTAAFVRRRLDLVKPEKAPRPADYAQTPEEWIILHETKRMAGLSKLTPAARSPDSSVRVGTAPNRPHRMCVRCSRRSPCIWRNTARRLSDCWANCHGRWPTQGKSRPLVRPPPWCSRGR
jgi:hypothetical protein